MPQFHRISLTGQFQNRSHLLQMCHSPLRIFRIRLINTGCIQRTRTAGKYSGLAARVSIKAAKLCISIL
jgi:hypothetical protein